MFVKRLILDNFRSYSHLEIEFDERRNYITGENAQGKTNILEAIYFLTLGRSFRKGELKDLIKTGSSEAHIQLTYHSEDDDNDHILSSVIGENYKLFSLDSEKLTKLSSLLGNLLCIYYDPSQAFFFNSEPSEKRKLLDETESKADKRYLYSIGRYQKLLKERNSALVQNYDIDVIDVLRDQLINLSYRIVTARKSLVKKLNLKAKFIYKKLFSSDKEITLVYRTNCPLDDDQESFRKNSLEIFNSNRSYENLRKMTLIGPHRDNLTCLLDGKDVSIYGSQGERKLASLSLSLAIAEEMKERLGKKMILLLDDISSYLDETRCRNLLESIDNDSQVFVTGTRIQEGFEKYNIFRAENGTLRRN